MSPVIAHPFPVKCIVWISGCFAIVRDSSLSNEVLFSFKLSEFLGQKFMHKQSRVGSCRAQI